MDLKGKKIILAVSGSIAAYKSIYLCRLLVKAGAEVRVIMTRAAVDMIGAVSFSTLSRNPVISDIHDGNSWNNHVELGLWADLMVIAPATANTLSHMANGICDSLLDAVYLSAKCPLLFAPAMDLDMWQHRSTQNNIEKLISFGNILIPVESGDLASGLTGPGRMAEPETIFSFISMQLQKSRDLSGKKALVTAGPTYEKIDPVRFIGNYSTGKMGIALAIALSERGADVTLVFGPGSADLSSVSDLKIIRVESAQDMYEACEQHFVQADITIMAAAVADYKPAEMAHQKIKKSSGAPDLKLIRTIDIAGTLGLHKKAHQVLVGFALETENEISNAREKMMKKNFDMIVLNSLRDPGAGFGHDTNRVTIMSKNGAELTTETKSKQEIAGIIVSEIIKSIKKS